MKGKLFWTANRRNLIVKAAINLFQALIIALFISETFAKSGIAWKIIFLLAMLSSLAVAILVCPGNDMEDD
ncbi:MAG TPA: hypothetical protein DCL49_04855 [Candidatus Omnitrophica bacterium]|nr:hypothetical protein [Candidatus Omnitrophota bacterium]